MALDLAVMLDTLSKSSVEISREERRLAITAATGVAEMRDHLGKDTKRDIEAALQNLSGHSDPYNGMLIESLLFSLTEDWVHLENLKPYLAIYNPEFLEAGGTFMAVRALLFNAHPAVAEQLRTVFTRELSKRLYDVQLEHIEYLYQRIAEKKDHEFRRNDIVVVLTPQYIGPPHAPSLDVLKFSHQLINQFNKTVIVIATALCSHACEGAIAPAFRAARNDDLVGAKSIKHEGVEIPFLFCGDGILSDNAMQQCLLAIDSISPEMILCVGEPAVVAEPFHERSFTFMYPLGHGIPHVRNINFHVYSNPCPDERALMEREGITERCRFVQQYDLAIKPPSNSLTREQFQIPPQSFVFSVVGTRLFNDVDETFLEMLEKIAADDRAHFMFAGNFHDYENKILPYVKLRGRTTFIGFQEDIMAVHNITDVFLNPARSGGGTGVVYALQAALPVLSLPVGDGGLVAEAFPQIDDYDHLAEIALEMIGDSSLREKYQDIARAEAPKFTGQLMKQILEEFDKFAETKTRVS